MMILDLKLSINQVPFIRVKEIATRKAKGVNASVLLYCKKHSI
jgi:hypothetical protein